ncbi:hypothetical protein SAMN05216175_101239 [Neptunomonas qingdaonensis]|uniref:Uncharacterized protein n=3 Tax=Neptunomonas qingdaonensis TaxID=1045558 RepID=A0A1I2LT41_9GAMM|nr:hypothetical protein SAMN05216175_101239 [Neptunomonas qingdaonensis]
MLPMGTIMAGSMLTGLLLATRLPVLRRLQKLPAWFRNTLAFVVFAAGSWNVFWYALRHLDEFWGVAALVSGCLMLLTSAYIVNAKCLPRFLQKIRPGVLFLLLCCSVLYGVTIYRL